MNKVGALWENDKGYLTGQLAFSDEQLNAISEVPANDHGDHIIHVGVFENQFKESDKHPDYVLLELTGEGQESDWQRNKSIPIEKPQKRFGGGAKKPHNTPKRAGAPAAKRPYSKPSGRSKFGKKG